MAGKEVTVWIAYCGFTESPYSKDARTELRVLAIRAVETEKQLILKKRHPVTFQIRAAPGEFAYTREDALAKYLASLESHRAGLTAQLAQTILHIALANAEIAAPTQGKSPDAE